MFYLFLYVLYCAGETYRNSIVQGICIIFLCVRNLSGGSAGSNLEDTTLEIAVVEFEQYQSAKCTGVPAQGSA